MRSQGDGRGAGQGWGRSRAECVSGRAGGCIMGGLYVGMAGVASQSNPAGTEEGWWGSKAATSQCWCRHHHAKPSRLGLAGSISIRCTCTTTII